MKDKVMFKMDLPDVNEKVSDIAYEMDKTIFKYLTDGRKDLEKKLLDNFLNGAKYVDVPLWHPIYKTKKIRYSLPKNPFKRMKVFRIMKKMKEENEKRGM